MDHATSNKKKRWRCRCLQSKKERKNGKEENKENYDEEELVMIYLNQKHDTIKKYPKHDEVLMPLVTFLNCLLYTSPSPRDGATSRMPSSA